MQRLAPLAALTLLAALAAAQTITVPNGYAGVEGNLFNAFPWNVQSGGVRVQHIYDSSHFTAQGVNGPMAITGLKWRANQTTASWTGGIYTTATVKISTCPSDWSAPSATFASNHGPNLVTAYSGPVTYLAGIGNGLGVPGPVVVDLVLSQQFVYDPTRDGDLVIDCDVPPGAWGGGSAVQLDMQSGGQLASRVIASTTYGQPTGLIDTANGLICEIVLAAIPSQEVLVPDLQAFNGADSFGTFRGAASHFQAAYDSSLFTHAGVTGPIMITRLRFRLRDGFRSTGGQSYTGAIVQVGNCAVDYAALTTTFALNRGAMGPAGVVPLLTIGPAQGTIPNDYVIDVDLTRIGATFVYDPTTATDFLIDITLPAAPVPATGISGFATSNSPALHKGMLLDTGVPASATGFLRIFAPVCLIDFIGAGGFATVVGARVESYGAGCATDASSFYQDFPLGEDFDMRGNPDHSLLLSPDYRWAPGFYFVTAGGTAPDLSATALGPGPPDTSDNGVVAHTPAFPFLFPFAGGQTTTISACQNGFVWLGVSADGDFWPTVSEFLGPLSGLARLAPAWHDWHGGRNVGSNPGSGMYVNSVPGGFNNGVVYVTWKEVGEAGTAATPPGVSVNTFQVALFENGNVEFRYGSMDGAHQGSTITGFSRGWIGGVNSIDPGSRDLSLEVPFATSVEGTHPALGLSVSARPILGTSITFAGRNNPGTALVSAVMLSLGAVQPGVSLPPLGPGCIASIDLSTAATAALFFAPVGTVTSLPVALPPAVPSVLMGYPLFGQYAALDPSGSVQTSNALRLTLGLQ